MSCPGATSARARLTAIGIAKGLPWSASSFPKVALSTAKVRLLRGVDPAGRAEAVAAPTSSASRQAGDQASPSAITA